MGSLDNAFANGTPPGPMDWAGLQASAGPLAGPAATGRLATPSGPVVSAIARAAAATGVDFDYLLAQARLESGLNPDARASTSSARGLFQFTGSTWLNTLNRHGAAYGLPSGIPGGPTNPLSADYDAQSGGRSRAELLAMRQDPEASALMAGELANDNRNYLYGVLGRDPDNGELYLAHFLGPEAAGRFLDTLSSDPGQSAAALLPRAAAANRAIFFNGTTPRSVGEVMDLLRGRLAAAMSDGMGRTGMADAAALAGTSPLDGAARSAPPAFTGGPIAREFQAVARDAGPSDAAGSQSGMPAPAGQASMAETLRDAFGMADGDGGSVPTNVRVAYGRIRSMGL